MSPTGAGACLAASQSNSPPCSHAPLPPAHLLRTHHCPVPHQLHWHKVRGAQQEHLACLVMRLAPAVCVLGKAVAAADSLHAAVAEAVAHDARHKRKLRQGAHMVEGPALSGVRSARGRRHLHTGGAVLPVQAPMPCRILYSWGAPPDPCPPAHRQGLALPPQEMVARRLQGSAGQSLPFAAAGAEPVILQRGSTMAGGRYRGMAVHSFCGITSAMQAVQGCARLAAASCS